LSVTLQQLLEEAQDRVDSGYYDAVGESRSHVSMSAALKGNGLQVMAEIKMASPSAGKISSRPGLELMEIYLQGGAGALSVLTEPDHFQGSIGALRAACSTSLPVLMKDFIVDERQLEAASRCGAAAVLLIHEAAPEADIRRMISRAHELNLEVVLESCSVEGMRDSLRSEADVIALNQRDLRNMLVDNTSCVRILPQLKRDERPLLVMSGINTVADALLARRSGADAILVGSWLASAAHPQQLLRSLGAVE